MTSAIEIVSLSSDVASSDMSAAISFKKRVRKAIIKPKNSEKSEKMAEKLEKPFLEPIIQPKNDETNIPSEESGKSPEKRGRGRPIGSKDKEKRRKKGEVIKPPVQHGKLGRPPGSKNKAVEIEEAIIPSTPASLIPPLAASSSVASAAARNVVASAYIPQPRATRPAPNCRETFRQLEANHLGAIVSKMFHA